MHCRVHFGIKSYAHLALVNKNLHTPPFSELSWKFTDPLFSWVASSIDAWLPPPLSFQVFLLFCYPCSPCCQGDDRARAEKEYQGFHESLFLVIRDCITCCRVEKKNEVEK